MTHTRSEAKIENGEYKTADVLLKTVPMPNGNLLCVHKNGPGGRWTKCYFSIYDPINKKTLTKKTYDNTALYSRCVGTRTHSHFIHFLSNNAFLYHRQDNYIEAFIIKNDTIQFNTASQIIFEQIYLAGPNLILGRDANNLDSSIMSIDINSLGVLETTLHDDKLIWNTLPSGKVYKFFHREDATSSKIQIFDHPHDSLPARDVVCNINKEDFWKMSYDKFRKEDAEIDTESDLYIEIFFNRITIALSENIVVFESYPIYVCVDLQTGRTCLLPEFDAFCALPDNRTLISVGDAIMILDHGTLEARPIALGLDLEKDQTCTSISFVNGKIFFTLSNSDTLYISDVSLLDAKPVVDAVMDAIVRMPEPLAKIIQGYRGLSLFDREEKSPAEGVVSQSIKLTSSV